MIDVVGVSVVICCYNSASRLQQTLRHLAAQVVPPGLCWEIVVVDNASADNTAAIARQLWPVDAPVPLRIVHEPTPGLSHARCRGFSVARYEFVSFIDDDNWVCPDWVERINETLNAHPEVGACGGLNEAVYEIAPPAWFDRFHGYVAIGPQGDGPGDVTDTRGMLFGAGLSVRKSAWGQLLAGRFRFSIGDRTGVSLLAGGDAELCFGLILAGWRLWYDPCLRLKHYMPATRLNWGYVRRLARAIGQSDAWLDAYRERLTGRPCRRFRSMLWAVALLARHPIKLALSQILPMEGDRHVPVQDLMVGRIAALLRQWPELAAQQAELREANWVRSRRRAEPSVIAAALESGA
jgi:glycosyltransferase involved in cell wall biosynthesis